jgi:type IV pilus assembly protein PilW
MTLYNNQRKAKIKTSKNKNFGVRKICGVTLVELMIAIAISSIVALGISSVYTSSKRSFKLQEEFSRLQENGRFAMNYIARFVRGAGYYGCSSALDTMVNNFNNQTEEFLFETGIEGYEASGTAPNDVVATLDEYPAVSTTAADYVSITSAISASLIAKLDPLPHTDIIASRVGENSGIEITENNDAANFRITYTGGLGEDGCGSGVDRLSGICPGDPLLISDCKKSVAFMVTGTNPANTPADPTEVLILHDGSSYNGQSNKETSFYEFAVGSEVVRLTTKFFYIGKGANGPALFVKDGESATGTELVEGVENLQVLYGEDLDADNIPNRYVPADQVINFADVTAVRISILLRSVKELPWRPTTQKLRLLSGTTTATATTITPPVDKRLRRTMSMNIKLRNRAFSL